MNEHTQTAIQIAAEVCKVFEGYSSKPYICPAGFWTVGYGHRCPKDHPEIHKGEAMLILRKDLVSAATASLRWCPVLAKESPGRLAAIIDWTFNLGSGRLQGSTMRRRINELKWEEAAIECAKWNRGGGRILSGLVKRRAIEVKLLLPTMPHTAR